MADISKGLVSTERLEQLADDKIICKVSWDERIALARECLQYRAARPLMYGIIDGNGNPYFDEFCVSSDMGILQDEVDNLNEMQCENGLDYRVVPLSIAPQVTSMEREKVRIDHAKWSQATFGNVGPVGPLKHLSKEALEAAAAPDDLSEWADMQFLLWDAQRNAGLTDDQITQAMIEKLAINKARQWPEPKDGEPRLHIATPNQRREADCDGA